jgi:hypothetical protein
MIGKSIYQIYEGENIYNATDYTKQELDKFIESLSTKFLKIYKSFMILCRN